MNIRDTEKFFNFRLLIVGSLFFFILNVCLFKTYTKKAAKKSMCYFIVFNKMDYTDSKMVKTPNIQKNAFEEITLKAINGGTFF